MSIEVRWIVSTLSSSLHAAAAIMRGDSIVDSKLEEALRDQVDLLVGDLAALGLDAEQFLSHLIPLSVRFDALLPLAEAAVAKLAGLGRLDGAAERIARRL